MNYFQDIYKQDQKLNLDQQVKILRNFPHLFTEEEGLKVGAEVTIEKFKHIFSNFARDKIPSPDGWLTDFYLHFF